MPNDTQIEHKISLYTKLSRDKRSKLLRWLARQNEDIIHLTFKKQKEYYFSLSKNQEADKSLLYMVALYLATFELYNSLNKNKGKNKNLSLYAMKDTTTLQVKQLKKKKPSQKYERLLNLQGKLLLLIDGEGLSFREVSVFFETYHRFKVSHTLIRQVYLDLKNGEIDV